MDTNDACPLCGERIEIFASGVCSHYICHECSTRWRVLGRHDSCPLCKTNLPKVFFTNTPRAMSVKGHPSDRKHKIIFETNIIRSKFCMLLEHRCEICKHRAVFKDFEQLRFHMEYTHRLSACDLCVKNTELFSKNRKFYSQDALQEHITKGDKDDCSHKGHPFCEFCDIAHFDRDELVRHLRKDHFFCHICEQDGFFDIYYNDHDEIRCHYRTQHFLCKEGECGSQILVMNAFRTESEFKKHVTTEHSTKTGAAKAKAIHKPVRDRFYVPDIVEYMAMKYQEEQAMKYEEEQAREREAEERAASIQSTKQDVPSLDGDSTEKTKSQPNAFRSIADILLKPRKT